ncbi:MAG TPA: IS630 family transposase [Acidobacteriota bacterium]|nr:IS630 family transposase [Acidobacteriota bacterium]
MSRIAAPITLSAEERTTLEEWSKGRKVAVRVAQRSRVIVMAAEGIENKAIAARLRISRPTVQLWRERFLALRKEGLEKDAPRPGRIPRITERKIRKIVEATIKTKPSNATHWSTRTMAKAQGVSEATVRRIWRQHQLKPHLTKTFKISRDVNFVDKLHDVVGLYLNPPDHSMVLSVDEKSQIQALDRTQPGLPMKKGRCGTMTHDYKRNGTTTLFAAMNMLTGKVIGDCMPRHRHQEFIRFLKKIEAETPHHLDLHLIVDNYGTHKHQRVQSWLHRHPRFHLHFTPTSSSWLNMVERWFRELTVKRIRRGSFQSVPELIQAINEYLNGHNQKPRTFVWTATAESILAKINKSKEALDALH